MKRISRTPAAAVLLDDDQDILRLATCPMCHTSATLLLSALEAGGTWRCARCGQHWDAARLRAVAAYAAWSVDHDRVSSGAPERTHEAALR
jgi:transcription elongation factor Elf1